MRRAAGLVVGVAGMLAVLGDARAEAPSAVAAGDALVEVHVTEVNGGLAFVDAGEAAGLRVGLVAGRDEAAAAVEPAEVAPDAPIDRVVAVNAKTAAIALAAGHAWRVGDRAVVRVHAVAPLAHPEGVGQWPELVPPARQQHPAEVPMSAAAEAAATEARVHLAVIAHAFAAHGQGENTSENELRVIGAFQLASEAPLGADLDVAARAYAGGYDSGHQPLIVRAATLRYGADPAAPAIAIGRLHYAATTLGLLDGGRAAVKVGERVQLAAFGGIVPDPLTGRPDTTATRFGGEFVYDAADSAYRPRVAIEAHGSTWHDALDERRLNVAATSVLGQTWLDGWVEVQQFPKDNPFHAKSVEVVGGGASVEWRQVGGGAHVGADVTYLTPDRSLRIAELIPAWVCTRVPGTMPTAMNQQCTGDDRLVATTAAAGVRGGAWSIDGAASFAAAHGQATELGGSGYVRGEVRPTEATALHATGAGGRAGFVDWVAGEAGVALVPSRVFDIGLAYRPEWQSETGANPDFGGAGAAVIHSILLDARYSAGRSIDVGLFALDSIAAHRGVLAALLTIAWRPTR